MFVHKSYFFFFKILKFVHKFQEEFRQFVQFFFGNPPKKHLKIWIVSTIPKYKTFQEKIQKYCKILIFFQKKQIFWKLEISSKIQNVSQNPKLSPNPNIFHKSEIFPKNPFFSSKTFEFSPKINKIKNQNIFYKFQKFKIFLFQKNYFQKRFSKNQIF